MDLRDYLRIVARRWHWMLAIGGVTFGLLYYLSRQQAPTFRAQAEILLEKVPEHPVYITDTALLTKVYDRNTRIRLISKRPVLQQAVLLLKEKKHFPDAALDGEIPNKAMDNAVNTIAGRLSVADEQGIDIVTIAYDDPSGDRAVEFANAVADAYVAYARDMALKGIDAAMGATSAEKARETALLVGLRQSLTEIPATPGYEAARDKRQDLQKHVAAVSDRIRDSQAKAAASKSERAALEPLLASPTLRYDPPPDRLPRTTALTSNLNLIDEQIASMRAGSTEADPRLQRQLAERARIAALIDEVRKEETEAAIAAHRQDLRRRVESIITDTETMQATIVSLEGERTSLKSQIDELDKQLSVPDPNAENRRRIETEVKRHEDNVGSLDINHQKMEIARNYVKDGPVKVLHRAQEPFERSALTGQRNLLLFGLTALIAAIGAAMAFEYLNTKIITEHDVKRYVNLPLYGSVLRIRNEAERLLVNVAVRSPLAEEFNRIGTLVETYANENSAKVFMVASSKAAEGKSTVSSNLAVALARGGKRVILIDADLRRSVLHRFFGTDNSRGLADYLRYTLGRPVQDEPAPSPVEFADILRPSGVENLSIVPSGPTAKNPVALLKSSGLRDLLVLAREQADIVLIDVPPVNIAVDTLVMASQVDGILMLVTSNETKKEEVTYAKRMVESANGRLIGCLLNKTSRQTGGYYHYYYYQQYKYYREP